VLERIRRDLAPFSRAPVFQTCERCPRLGMTAPEREPFSPEMVQALLRPAQGNHASPSLHSAEGKGQCGQDSSLISFCTVGRRAILSPRRSGSRGRRRRVAITLALSRREMDSDHVQPGRQCQLRAMRKLTGGMSTRFGVTNVKSRLLADIVQCRFVISTSCFNRDRAAGCGKRGITRAISAAARPRD
jgi:hypothetical protein